MTFRQPLPPSLEQLHQMGLLFQITYYDFNVTPSD